MTTNLFLAVKSNWRSTIEFTKNYIQRPERLNFLELQCVVDQIWAEEIICKET